MPKLLAANAQKGWPYIQRLLVDLFLFMEPFLRKAELDEPVCMQFLDYFHVLNHYCMLILMQYESCISLGEISVQRNTPSVVGATS